MEIDTDRIDEAVLALLYLGLHDRWRAWKGFDWDAMEPAAREGPDLRPGRQGQVGRVHRGGACARPSGCSASCSLPVAEPSAARSRARRRGLTGLPGRGATLA